MFIKCFLLFVSIAVNFYHAIDTVCQHRKKLFWHVQEWMMKSVHKNCNL